MSEGIIIEYKNGVDKDKQLKQLLLDYEADTAKIKDNHTVILEDDNNEKKEQDEEKLAELIGSIKQRQGLIRNELKNYEDKLNALHPPKQILITESQNDVQETDIDIEKQPLTVCRDPEHKKIKREYESNLLAFIKVTQNFKSAQLEFVQECKSRMKAELKNSNVGLFSDDEIEEMIEEGNLSFYSKNYDAAMEHHKNFLSVAESRHRGLLKLQKSVEELADLIREHEAIAEKQAEYCILDNAIVDCEIAEDATYEIKQAIGLSQEFRRKLLGIIVFGIIFALVTGAVIYVLLKGDDEEEELPKPMPNIEN